MREWFKRFLAQFHSWGYRTPNDRTCTTCGLSQSRFAQGIGFINWWDDANFGYADPWKDSNEGVSAPCNPAAQRAQAQKGQP